MRIFYEMFFPSSFLVYATLSLAPDPFIDCFWLCFPGLDLEPYSGHSFGFSAPPMAIRIKIKFFLFPVFSFLGSPSRGKILTRCPEDRKIAGLALAPSHFEYFCLNSLHLLIVKPSWLLSLCNLLPLSHFLVSRLFTILCIFHFYSSEGLRNLFNF